MPYSIYKLYTYLAIFLTGSKTFVCICDVRAECSPGPVGGHCFSIQPSVGKVLGGQI